MTCAKQQGASKKTTVNKIMKASFDATLHKTIGLTRFSYVQQSGLSEAL